MIGSGFSLNAKPKTADALRFPLWSDLLTQMFYSLYPTYSRDEGKLTTAELKFKQQQLSNPLVLAQHFEGNDRNKLDTFIEESIPDDKHTPSMLHQQMLGLPWVDVFTTNYDTLLEKASDSVSRPYSKVLTEKAIPSSPAPRIVKLHGTLGQRNYVFTERDFANYPHEHRAFVNQVQNSMMFNTFCLFGFSGDDPNFKSWNQWVLRVLADYTPQIYLIGLLKMTDYDKSYWQNNKVTPLDLSSLLLTGEKQDHGLAIERFLRQLHNEQDKIILSGHSEEPTTKISELLLSWPDTTSITHSEFYLPDTTRKGNVQFAHLRRAAELWREQRLNYPGWIVTPRSNREALWAWTERWVDPTFETVKSLKKYEALLVLRELCWRIRRSMFPFFINQVDIISKLLEAVNPFPENLDLANSEVVRGKPEYSTLPWTRLEEAWLELAFVIVQEAREDLDQSRFDIWMSRLEKVLSANSHLYNRWCHERCLMSLYKLNQEELKQRLSQWQSMEDDPTWLLRKSAFFAELGDFDKAEELAEKSIEIVKAIEESSNLTFVSTESWALHSLNGIKQAKSFFGDNSSKLDFRARQEELKALRCNPEEELEFLETHLNASLPEDKPSRTVKYNFDPDRITTTRHLGIQSSVLDSRSAFALLTLPEQAGIPMRSGNVSFLQNADTAVRWIWPFAPLWAISAYVRKAHDNNNLIDDWLTRIEVSNITQVIIDTSFTAFTQALKQVVESLPHEFPRKQSFSEETIIPLSEILSRLTIRFSPEQLQELLKIGLTMYESPAFQKDFRLYDVVNKVFKRVLYALPGPETSRLLVDIIGLSLPGDETSLVDPTMVENWPEPTTHISWGLIDKKFIKFDSPKWASTIGKLIVDVEYGDYSVRSRAVERLRRLADKDLLTGKQRESFGKALWSRTLPELDLPSDTRIYPHGFMYLPAPNVKQAENSLRSFIENNPFPNLYYYEEKPIGSVVTSLQRKGKPTIRYTYSFSTQSLLKAWKYASKSPMNDLENDHPLLIDWTTFEAEAMLKKISVWWFAEKEALLYSKDLDSLSKVVEQRIGDVNYIVRRILFPRFKASSEETKREAINLLKDIDASGFSILSVLPSTLYLNNSEAERQKVAAALHKGIHSQNDVEVFESIHGLVDWLALQELSDLPKVSETLSEALALKLIACRQPALQFTLDVFAWIINVIPQALSDVNRERVLMALQFLLEDTSIPRGRMVRVEAHSVEEVTRLRAEAAKLAGKLYSYYLTRSINVPEVIQDWKNVAEKNPLPEIRKGFLGLN